ncbi:MAG: CHAT domain-containing protein, partial [Prevotella sp.]|nr:CHAT domain-containing protein [Prevotella sp.]
MRQVIILLITLLSFTINCNAQENTNKESLSLFIKSIGYLQNKEYKLGVDMLSKAYELQTQSYGNVNHKFDVSLLKWLARGYNYLYDVDKAINFQNKAVEEQYALTGEKNEDYIDLLNDLTILYLRAENYKRAIETGNCILKICRNLPDDFTEKDVAGYKVNIAQAYLGLGNPAEAKSILEKSVRLYEKDKQQIKGVFSILNYVSVVSTYSSACLYSGDIDEAIEYNDKSIQVCRIDSGLIKTDYYATLLANKSLCFDYKGDLNKATVYAKEALNIRKLRGGEYNMSYVMSLNNVAKLEMLKKSWDEAEAKLNRCVGICDFLGVHNELYYAVKFNIMVCNLFKSHNSSYSDCTEELKDIYNYTKLNIINNFLWLTADERKVFLKKSMLNYLRLFIPLIAYHEPKREMMEMCYDFSLLLKGQLLNTQVSLRDLIAQSNDKRLIDMMNNLREQRAFLIHQYQIPISRRSLTNTDSLENKCKEEEATLIDKSYVYGNYAQSMKLTWRDVQTTLKPNDTAIEFLNFSCGKDSMMYAALVISKEMASPKMIPLAWKRDFDQYAANLYSGYPSKRMYHLIWKPLEPYMHEGSDVYFSPSGMFYQTNIEAFRDSSGIMASEKYHLYRLSSTREICYDRKEFRPQTASLYGNIDYFMDAKEMADATRKYHISANGDVAMRGFVVDSTSTRGPLKPLAGTGKEVENILEQLEKKNIQVGVFKGTEGTEESFKALSGKRIGIIHLATHGFFFNDLKAKSNAFISHLMINDDRSMVDMSMKRAG